MKLFTQRDKDEWFVHYMFSTDRENDEDVIKIQNKAYEEYLKIENKFSEEEIAIIKHAVKVKVL